MNELLQHVLDAHGGLEPWSRFNFVQATIMTGGELFAMKNEPQEPIPRTSSYSLPSHAADDPLRSRQEEKNMVETFGTTSTTEEVLSGIDLHGKRILVTGVSVGLGIYAIG